MSDPLADERNESDGNLQRERKLVDATVNEIQHDKHVGPTLRRAIRDLRTRLRRQRFDVDHAKTDARRTTDAALEEEPAAQPGLREIMFEIDVIAASVHSIRTRSGDIGELTSAIEVAADRILELVTIESVRLTNGSLSLGAAVPASGSLEP